MLPCLVLSESLIRTRCQVHEHPRAIELVRIFPLTPLESALPQNAPITPLQSADPETRHLKSFRIRTYEKRRGEGVKLLTKIVVPRTVKSLTSSVAGVVLAARPA